jgi:hypothetical protein
MKETSSVRVLWSLLLGTLLVLNAPLAASFDLDRMQVRAPQPPANHISEVNYLNGRWIIADEKGTVSTSIDGADWSTVTTPYPKGIEDLTYYNGLYAALGVDGRTLLLSGDLVNWELSRPAGFPNNPNQFLEAFGYLYVVGWSGGLSRTQDLVTWEELDTGELSRADGIATNGSVMVLAGASGEIMTSDDGTTWTLRQSDIPGVEGLGDSFLCVHWVEDQFIAGGKDGTLMTSPDGIDWTLVETSFEDWFFTVVSFNGKLTFPGRNGRILQTEDFQNWVEIETGLTDTIQDLHDRGDVIMAVGRQGGIAVSTNGTDWELPLAEGDRTTIGHLAYHDGTHLATSANSLVYISNDTEAWLPAFTIPEERQSAGLEHFLGQFTLITNRGKAYTSPNGLDWTEVTGPGAFPNRTRVIDDRLWVVGRSGFVSWTDDLVTWTEAAAGDGDLNDIARGPVGFMAVGRTGVLLWSVDGAAWAPVGVEETRNLNTAVYFSGHYLAFGFPGILWKSPDGVEWTKEEGFPRPSGANNAFIHEGSLILAGYLGQVDVTTDGETWENFFLPTNNSLTDLIVTPNRTLASGGQGTILSSPADIGPGYAAWRDLRFNLLQRLDPDVSGPDADPDLDNRPNLLEYYSNSQPLIHDPEAAVSLVFEEMDGNLHPVLSFRRSKSATDVLLEVQHTGDATAWFPADSQESPLGGIAEEVVQPLDADTDAITLRFDSGLDTLPSVLVRLQLSLSEEL